ncbi:RagB/SusD family nutrient uptake outer membrane protein [uncultured Sunxiuqinia sp.]|uniref:RagB/SusD family nutrient uptake outer membrane protein n=1 Tax=uncultured Sunxiuqinia sp. TaxID=1573825 RepID=UPI00262CB68F|nr:RagB/SusD family nutrient uptake outer membrane protein [uncultured Sunxiuqinia sp.]
MKKIIYSLVLLLMIFSSCEEDIMDKKPLDKYSEIDVWSDRNLAMGFVRDVYNDVLGSYYWDYTDDYTDNSVLWSFVGNASNVNLAFDNIDQFFSDGYNRYPTIRKCNLIIEKATSSEGLTEDDKAYFAAEGKFLRGMMYFWMARRYGGLMIVDKVLTPEDEMLLSRSSLEDTYAFILKDLEEAAQNLPESAAPGRATKGAAYAMVARAALQAAAYTGNDSYFTKVKTAAEQVIGIGYTLDDQFQDMHNSFARGQSSPEIILAFFKSEENNSFESTLIQGICGLTANDRNRPEVTPQLVEPMWGWPQRFPSHNLTDAYLVVDTDGKAKKWEESSYHEEYVANGNSGLVSELLYANRDARFYATIAHDSSQYFVNTITTREDGNMHWNSNHQSYGWGLSRSGYYIRKGLYEGKMVWHSDPTAHHRPIIRLGAVYLDYVEALLKTGDNGKAVEYLNKTRTVHGQLPALDAGLNAEELWEAYEIERRAELAFEEDRYWSLMRWGKYEGLDIIPELNTPTTRVNIAADGLSFFVDDSTEGNNHMRKWSNRRYLFPIPEGERQQNSNLTQNPGW